MAQDTDSDSYNHFLSIGEVRELIGSIRDARDKLMVRVLYETGCTLSELCCIRVCDVAGNKIKINDAQASSIRFSSISGKLSKDISLYVQGSMLKPESYLISTRQSPKISERRVGQLLIGYAEKCGFGKLNPQMLRYFHIAHAYQNGVFMETISRQLGITRHRIFQVLEELKITTSQNFYGKFLGRI